MYANDDKRYDGQQSSVALSFARVADGADGATATANPNLNTRHHPHRPPSADAERVHAASERRVKKTRDYTQRQTYGALARRA